MHASNLKLFICFDRSIFHYIHLLTEKFQIYNVYGIRYCEGTENLKPHEKSSRYEFLTNKLSVFRKILQFQQFKNIIKTSIVVRFLFSYILVFRQLFKLIGEVHLSFFLQCISDSYS